MLDQYKDRKGRVFASWVSDTLLCGTGECIYVIGYLKMALHIL
jgi:hypothetical protein